MGKKHRRYILRVTLIVLMIFFTTFISVYSIRAIEEVTIELYNKQAEDNVAFEVVNMFPADKITKDYRVLVFYHDKVTVYYQADIRKGYEKLAEVLKVAIILNGDLVYDGLMKDMDKAIEYSLSSDDNTTSELHYQITVYLNSSVGNEYQNKELVADFKWWVEESKFLDPLPDTGDHFNLSIWMGLFVSSFSLGLLIVRKKQEKVYGCK